MRLRPRLLCFVPASTALDVFYGRYFEAGADPVKVEAFNRGWEHPLFRRTNRLITLVWGCVLLAEFTLRAWMVWTLPVATVLAVNPIVFNATILLIMTWTFRYVRQVRSRATR